MFALFGAVKELLVILLRCSGFKLAESLENAQQTILRMHIQQFVVNANFWQIRNSMFEYDSFRDSFLNANFVNNV